MMGADKACLACKPASVAAVGTVGLIAEARKGGNTKINQPSDSALSLLRVSAITGPCNCMSLAEPASLPRSLQSSVYLSERPRAFSTGYFRAFAAIFDSMLAATSRPVAFANSSA